MKFNLNDVFVGASLLQNMTDPSLVNFQDILLVKHQQHDQSTHGNWAGESSPDDYGMSHRPALGEGYGASLDDVTNGIYPDDVYSPRGVQIYGTGYKDLDKKAHAMIMEYRGKPDKTITIYRAVPKNPNASKINVGDWVTPIKEYAVQHGESYLNDDYQILVRDVKAKEIFTSGDSWLEWGYSPESMQKHQQHDQSSHGNWAVGKFSDELKNWNPEDKVPSSPRNAGGVTGRALFAWEHGPDGQNFIDLFRKYAAQELGLPVPQTPFDQGGYMNYMMQRGWGAPNRNEVKGLLKAIENGKPQPTLYRGLASKEGENSPEFAALKNVKEGDTFDMPLVSTTRSLGVASWYAAETAANKPERILVRIKNGAKGYAVPNPMYEQDSEVIVSGKFRVNSVEKVSSPYWARTSFEVRRSNPIPNLEDRNPGQVDDRFYEVVTYTPRLRDLAGTDQKTAKKYYDAVASGNYKSIQTADFKLTNDRPNSGIRSDVPAPLSAWFKESAKDFTLIDIEMIEPHSVAKVDGEDYGNMFHNLFNGSSSIDDSGRNFQKHQSGTHDQSTHGNWAGVGWDKVFSDSSIETKVNTFKQANPDATPQQISAFKSRTKKFFQNHDVVKKGNTLVTFQNKIDKNITGVDFEDRSKILQQVDFLQDKFPLEKIYILAQDMSRQESRGGAAVKTAKGGTAIELNVLSVKFYHALSAGEDKLMPLETKDNAVDFTLAHEWGHAYANVNPRAIMRVSNILKANPSLKNSLSDYAGKNENETFAEIFAQNAMEIKLNTPKTDVTSAVQEVLK